MPAPASPDPTSRAQSLQLHSADDDQSPSPAHVSAVSPVARRICWLLAGLAIALTAGRIAVVRSKTGEVPFQSANDRSRWSTIAALIDYRTYQIDHFQTVRAPKTNRRLWQSIDRVQHRGADGRIHDYSSKPPLLPTLIAPLYGVWKSVTGIGIQTRPLLVGRVLLAAVNLPLLAITIGCMIALAIRYARGDLAAILLAAMASFGTYLLPFTVSLNNHLPAAAATALTALLLDRQARHGGRFAAMFLCGMSAAFAVANELPALSMLPLAGLIALRIDLRKTLLAFLPGVALVAVAFFATNFWAHGSLRPPYMHRGLGSEVTNLTLQPAPAETDMTSETETDVAAASDANTPSLPPNTVNQLAQTLECPPQDLTILPARVPNRFRIDTPDQTYALQLNASATQPDSATLYLWDDWYDYPGTYWVKENLRGIDRGEPSRTRYALNMLIGHHGVFSLTPFWLLAIVGLFASRGHNQTLRDNSPTHPHFQFFPLAAIAATCLVTGVCMAFYVMRPEIDRNYGGVSVCFRWLLWQTPLWFTLTFAAVNRLAQKPWGARLCVVLILLSVMSTATALDSPWQHPWAYRLLENLGWIATR